MPLDIAGLIDRLEKIREKKGLSKEAFAIKELEVGPATFKGWTYDKHSPNAENINKILEYLEENEKEGWKGQPGLEGVQPGRCVINHDRLRIYIIARLSIISNPAKPQFFWATM